jgi:hypothetical protein
LLFSLELGRPLRAAGSGAGCEIVMLLKKSNASIHLRLLIKDKQRLSHEGSGEVLLVVMDETLGVVNLAASCST